MTAKRGEPAMREHADMPLRAAGDRGDLLGGEPFAPQVDCLPLRRWQLAEQLAKAGGEFPPLGGRGWIDSGGTVRRRVARLAFHVDERPLAAGPPEVIEGPIAADAKQPGRGVLAGRGPRLATELHECVLDDVGGEVGVAEQPPGIPHKRQLVGIDGRQDPALPVACGFHVAALGGSVAGLEPGRPGHEDDGGGAISLQAGAKIPVLGRFSGTPARVAAAGVLTVTAAGAILSPMDEPLADDAATGVEPAGKTVRPLDANERRVLGVLIEKAKTTPDQYPLSLNALVTGCNQKSNRDPVMMLDEEQVMRAVRSLQTSGAVAEVFGSGKLPRYRHLAYDWLGVGKEELAIVGELLCRGEQTEGDLRGRASRMDEIPDLTSLRRHLDALVAKGLVIWLSPPGRGRMLTHGLLPEEKLDKVRREVGAAIAAGPVAKPAATDSGEVAALKQRIAELEAEVAELRRR